MKYGFYFSELSLQQSRSKRILEAMDVMYSEASKQSFASGKIFQKHPNTYLKTDSKRKCQSYFTTYKMDQNVCHLSYKCQCCHNYQ